MKNLNYISALLFAAALATSCSNEEMIENGASADDFTLIATTGADTRTTVGIDDYKVRWTSGDSFYAFSKEKPDGSYSAKGTFDWISGKDTEGKFKGQMTGKMSELQYAVYPASAYKTKTLTFPAEYTFPNSNAPMFGKVEGKTVKFNQLLSGMMRIKLIGLGKNAAGSLTLKGANIAGPATLSIDESGEASLVGISENGIGSVKVSFVNPSDTEPLVLDIPVPAATYADGITATLALDGAANTPQVFKSITPFTVELRKIIEMPEISNIEIDASTGDITFSKAVENVDEAIEAMEAGAKNVTIKEMAAESITIPNSSKADAPVTINISSISINNFTIEGASGATDTSVKINMPKGTNGTVTVKNIAHVEISGGWTAATNQMSNSDSNPLVIAAGEGVKELTVKEIDHVEISGNWEKVNSSTGPNTLVLQANAVVDELIVNEGNIEIGEGGVIKNLTLNNDVAINNLLWILAEQTMTVNLGTHTLTLGENVSLKGNNFAHIYGKLILKGASTGARGKVIDTARGLSLRGDNAELTIEDVDYTCTGSEGNASGLHMYQHVNHTTAIVKNSTITSGYYCINTNGMAEAGTDNLFTLEDSEFTAAETALMINNNAKVEATNCKFTGGWQAAFLRGGTFEFKTCDFNLNVLSDDINGTAAGAEKWGTGNNAPSAAITAGNRDDGNEYNHKTNLTLANGCTFTVKEAGAPSNNYPAIYLDAKEGVGTQGVTFTYDESCRTAFEAAGEGLVINNMTGEVIVNTVPYKGNGGE